MFIYDVHSGRTDSRPAKLEAARIVDAEGEAWVLRGEEGGLELWNPEKQTVTASYRLPPENALEEGICRRTIYSDQRF